MRYVTPADEYVTTLMCFSGHFNVVKLEWLIVSYLDAGPLSSWKVVLNIWGRTIGVLEKRST